MATKKTAKKATKKVVKFKPLSFNKANAKLFADNIFSDMGGRVTFLKLCEGDLSNGKDDGRTLHCALGEAYFTFVDANVAGFVKNIQKKFGEEVSYTYDDEKGTSAAQEGCYQPKYSDEDSSCTHTGTLAVVDALVEVAELKNSKPETKKKLAEALLDTMQSNDNACGVDVEEAMNRSKDVADMWRDSVLPLLK